MTGVRRWLASLAAWLLLHPRWWARQAFRALDRWQLRAQVAAYPPTPGTTVNSEQPLLALMLGELHIEASHAGEETLAEAVDLVERLWTAGALGLGAERLRTELRLVSKTLAQQRSRAIEPLRSVAVPGDLTTAAAYRVLSKAARMALLCSIEGRRERQISIWGPDTHSGDTWMRILSEEVGELAQALDPARFDPELALDEAVDIAAVAVAIAEQIRLQYPGATAPRRSDR